MILNQKRWQSLGKSAVVYLKRWVFRWHLSVFMAVLLMMAEIQYSDVLSARCCLPVSYTVLSTCVMLSTCTCALSIRLLPKATRTTETVVSSATGLLANVLPVGAQKYKCILWLLAVVTLLYLRRRTRLNSARYYRYIKNNQPQKLFCC